MESVSVSKVPWVIEADDYGADPTSTGIGKTRYEQGVMVSLWLMHEGKLIPEQEQVAVLSILRPVVIRSDWISIRS